MRTGQEGRYLRGRVQKEGTTCRLGAVKKIKLEGKKMYRYQIINLIRRADSLYYRKTIN
jgi:hypothetical protein